MSAHAQRSRVRVPLGAGMVSLAKPTFTFVFEGFFGEFLRELALGGPQLSHSGNSSVSTGLVAWGQAYCLYGKYMTENRLYMKCYFKKFKGRQLRSSITSLTERSCP